MASKRIQKELQVTDGVLCRLADAKSWASGSEPPCCTDEFDKSARVRCCVICAGFTERSTNIMLSRTCRRRPLSLAGRACCFSKCQVTSCNTAEGPVYKSMCSGYIACCLSIVSWRYCGQCGPVRPLSYKDISLDTPFSVDRAFNDSASICCNCRQQSWDLETVLTQEVSSL